MIRKKRSGRQPEENTTKEREPREAMRTGERQRFSCEEHSMDERNGQNDRARGSNDGRKKRPGKIGARTIEERNDQVERWKKETTKKRSGLAARTMEERNDRDDRGSRLERWKKGTTRNDGRTKGHLMSCENVKRQRSGAAEKSRKETVLHGPGCGIRKKRP